MKPPWLAVVLASLRERGFMKLARDAAGVSEREMAEACAADPALQEELEVARQEGLRGGAYDRRGSQGSGARSAADERGGVDGGGAGAQRAPKMAEMASAHRGAGKAGGASGAALTDGEGRTQAISRVRDEARAAFGDSHHGTLLWIDARCQQAKMHPLDPWWAGYFRDFYASGKMTGAGRGGLRAGKSDSIPRALVNDAIFSLRELDPATVGVIPIMSRDRTEATDRFTTIRQILRACGVEAKGKDDIEAMALPGGLGGEYESRTLPSGGHVIALRDSQGHKIEFRIYPARVSGAIGFTGVGGFCDEVDLWPWEDEIDQATGKRHLTNPAGKVIELLEKRFTTQPEARLYVWSASYAADSAHAKLIAKGDTMIRHIARLGERGARCDESMRRKLVDHLLALGRPIEARLFDAADPGSTDIPSWVTNPTKADILRCYALSDEKLAPMLGLYGGRAAEHGAGALSDDDFEIVGEYGRYHEETPAERDYG